ncbi:prenyltransferase UbiA [Achromatium sp. WMS3]|nr:prenyltransferase UbiA [Achromatium sp. WMS3]
MNFYINILKLIRPHQYIKNFFIFAPLFFAAKLGESQLLLSTVTAFVAFSLTASAVYVFNDYIDVEDDRCHPKKKDRPLASGTISKSQAITIMSVLSLSGLGLILSISTAAMLILLAYVAMNIAYSFHLKHIAILDVMIIAIGFVLRLFIGSVATDISLTSWIVVMTFLLALFLALAKRRDDVLIYLDTGQKIRKVIDGYNLQLIDTAMAIMASVVIVAYISYTTSPEVVTRINSEYLYLTALFVIMGIMRYLQIAFVMQDSGSPTKIVLKDRFIQLTMLGWVSAFTWILY